MAESKKIIKKTYDNLNPEQGLAALLIVNDAPKGYKLQSMKRRGKKATVTYVLEEDSVENTNRLS